MTSSYNLRDIIDANEIASITECKVLKEKVTYAFYGRISYRNKDDMTPASLSSLFPSALILDPGLVPTPKYVFGFDSGAFYEGAMDQYLHPYMPLFDFLLAPDISSAARLVMLFSQVQMTIFIIELDLILKYPLVILRLSPTARS